MNNDKSHLPFLDGIRGIAILAVFLFHSLGASYGFDNLPWAGMFRDFDVSRSFLLLYPLTYGSAGVAVFFVVSGFCIHLSYQRSKDKRWKCFFNRRFFRIYPPYLLAVFVFFFIWPWGSFNVTSLSQVAQLGSHVLSIHNFHERSFFGINPSFWGIAVEIQLYVIYPLLVFMTSRFGWGKSLIVVGVAEVAIRSVSAVHGIYSEESLPRFITASPFAYWLSWSLGAYLAECFLQGRTSRLFAARFEIILVISLLLPLFKPTAPFMFLSFSWLTAIAIDRLITGRWPVPGMRGGIVGACWSHLSFLGIVSYSFYLFHQPIIGLTKRAIHKAFPETFVHPLLSFAICAAWYPIILILSTIIYKWIEQPSIALGKVTWERIKESNKMRLDNPLPAPCRSDSLD
jgi:peptidoglycan/LPS O-acetylase OafA/YrhL